MPRTAELQPEAYGEVSAVELPPEVNMVTSVRQLEAAEEVVPLPCTAEEAVLLSSPTEKAVPLPCMAEEAVLLSSTAEEVVPLPCTAEEAVLLPSSPAGDAAQPSSPAGDAAQPSSPAGDAAQRSRPIGGGAQRFCSRAAGGGALHSTFSAAWVGAPTFNPGGGAAPPLCCPTEAASLFVAARDSSHRGLGPPLAGVLGALGGAPFGGGFCYAPVI
ncbi:uncharacterized protein Rv2082-like [Ictalurus furcatus]|uniref:uncharacterized protein Rv2082-like n=1 Tax=Ictalurus furcatus TaxID=66913 RepID=UPI00234FDC8F|nr:uncharacterized protein Rv2082-like [Ictalurus furcatus]